ncbi:MAG: hypothetical protein RLZ53_503 [Actinomycetota bacterium]
MIKKSPINVGIALGIASALTVGSITVAQADPATKVYGELVGLGSDTTMDVMDGISEALGKNGKLLKIASYKAIGSETVTTRSGLAAIPRFNGSGAGRDALYTAIGQSSTKSLAIAPNADGTSRAAVTVTTADLAGKIDFARSSSGPSGARADGVLTYIPFAIDAMTYAVSPNSKIPADIPLGTSGNTTEVSLMNIYKGNITRVITNNGVFVKLAAPDYVLEAGEASNTINAYIPQAGSGTRSYWIGQVGITETQISAGTTAAKDVFTVGSTQKSVQEHDGSAVAADPYGLVGFSISQFVAQTNRVSTSRLNGAVLRSIGGVAPTVAGSTAGTIATNPLWTAIKRTVYNIVPTALANASGSNKIKTAFVGENSLVCQAKAVIQKYGYGLLSYPADADGAAGTTAGGNSTICGNITAANRVGAPSVSTVSLGTPTVSASGTSATVVATVSSNGNQGGTVKVYNGTPLQDGSNLVGTGIVAKGGTTASIKVQDATKQNATLDLKAVFIPALAGIAESSSAESISQVLKGESVLSATVTNVRASVIPSVAVTVRNGLSTSTAFAAGVVTVVAINSKGDAFFAYGTLDNNGAAAVSFESTLAKGTYTVWVNYPGSSTNVSVKVKKTLKIS